MKVAAVIIDAWKLETFKRNLDAAKYSYTEHAGPTENTLTLRVSFNWVADLKPVIEKANRECQS